MKTIYKIIGFLCLAMGCIGIVLPILPTTPFFMISAFCFAKSSQKLNGWFLSTKVYKNYLESYVNEKSMTLKSKLSLLTSITILLTICFFIVRHIMIAQIAIAIVWLCHVLYFTLRIKTLKPKANDL